MRNRLQTISTHITAIGPALLLAATIGASSIAGAKDASFSP